jgi:hypothetical protein
VDPETPGLCVSSHSCDNTKFGSLGKARFVNPAVAYVCAPLAYALVHALVYALALTASGVIVFAPANAEACNTQIRGECSNGKWVYDGSGTFCKPNVGGLGDHGQQTVSAGLIERSTANVKSGEYLVTTDGRYMFNLSYACNGTYRGYTVRIFDPHNNWSHWRTIRTCDDDGNSIGTDDVSFYINGIVADPDWLYAIEWGGGGGRVIRINWNTTNPAQASVWPQGYVSTSCHNSACPPSWPTVPQNNGYRLVNGQYDWLNKRVVLGALDQPGYCYWNVGNNPWQPNGTSGIHCTHVGADDVWGLNAQGSGGYGVLGTDGTYVYAKRWSTHSGDDRLSRHGFDVGGMSRGTWQGWASNKRLSRSISGFYYPDGHFYSAKTSCAYGLQKVRVTQSNQIDHCDNKDDDCDGSIDENCDIDNDNYCDRSMPGSGNPSPTFPTTWGSNAPSTCTSGRLDCDDCNSSVRCTIYYRDADNDGWGTSQKTCECSKPSGWVLKTGDCDDGYNLTYPGAPELCDGRDNDCNGQTDEIYDQDNDGVATCFGDCNDGNNKVKPGHPEICDGKDNDCDGAVDEIGGCSPNSWPTCSTSVPGNCSTGSWVNDGTGNWCKPNVYDYGYTSSQYISAGLLERSTGRVQSGGHLVTTNGEHVFNLSYGCYNTPYRGWSARIFDPRNGWNHWRTIYTCNDDNDSSGTDDWSFYTDGVIADKDYIYPVEWTGGSNARIVRIRWNTTNPSHAQVQPNFWVSGSCQDDVCPQSFPWTVPQQHGYRLINGQYDWVNKRVIMGGLDQPGFCYWNVGNGAWQPNGTSGINCTHVNADDVFGLNAPGAAGYGVIGTDGWYVYAKRWSSYPGSDKVSRHGYGKAGMGFGSWQGWAANRFMSSSLSGFYYPDGFFYSACDYCPYGLERIRVTNSSPAGSCNNIDENCNGVTDEICDMDNDNYCDRNLPGIGNPSPTFPTTWGGGAPATCTAGRIDCDDCNPNVSCTKYWVDHDDDGWGAGPPSCECSTPGSYWW